jgi:glycogen debranching enzyme
MFWSDTRGGYYYLALDGQKTPVDSITSNMGHLLWSGIVPAERAGMVAHRLLSPELFSGWGIRTMSTDDAGFNPIAYHCGTVWPHDNSLAIMGLHSYGFHEEANRLWAAMMDAAQNFPDFRLPEAFAGFDRRVAPFPVEYPTASSPQAWAAAAPLLMLRAAVGAKPNREKQTITINPHFPPWLHQLELTGCLAFGHLFDITVEEGVGVVSDTGPLP